MIKSNNIAWFLDEDGRAPLYFHVMYDEGKSGIKRLDFKQGKYVDLMEKGCIYFYVKHEGKYAEQHKKYANAEYVRKWDFLPNSSRLPLANAKALKVLEEVALGEFQAITVKLLMPDGTYIEDYKLINPLHELEIFKPEKSILSKRQLPFPTSAKKYDKHLYDKHGLKGFNLAVDTERLLFFGSEKLRQAVKKAKLVGLQFKDSYGTSHFFLDE